MKLSIFFIILFFSLSINAQETKGGDNNTSIEMLTYEEVVAGSQVFDSIAKSSKQLEEEQLKEELKSKGLDNLSELNYNENGPVRYYIVLKAFSNLAMAKKYIEGLHAKGFTTLKILSESNIHRVYRTIAYSPEEASKLIERAKLIESEAWILEQSY